MAPSPMPRTSLALPDLVTGIRAGNRAVLARAITLVESTRPAHQELAQKVLQEVLPYTGKAHRIGITGVPGVGKSTMIDQLGTNLTGAGHKVAVLAVDPTSTRTGGSILGDKTRMARLAVDPDAYIRPSPTSGTLGGVTRKTRETMALCEAAGFDIVIVETVGVGQSETAVAGMVDIFVVLLLPGGGDDLQGIKKGVLEIADLVAINKADGDGVARARQTAADYMAAIGILTPRSASWTPPVMTMSGLTNTGLDCLWGKIEEHRRTLIATGELQERRQSQAVRWMHDMVEQRLAAWLRSNPRVAARMPHLEVAVRDGLLTPALAAAEIVGLLGLPVSLSEGA
jgi:LAO/AO transport system kinase